MRRRLQTVAGSLVLAATSCAADDFSFELSADRRQGDNPFGLETDTLAVGATYYFGGISDDTAPLALAPFLSRSSRVSGFVSRTEETQSFTFTPPLGGTPVTTKSTDDNGVLSIDGRFVFGQSGWIVGGGAAWFDLEEPDSAVLDTDIEQDAYVVTGGKYLTASTAIEIFVQESTLRTEITPLLCPPLTICPLLPQPLGFEIENEDIGLSVRHVGGAALRWSVVATVVDTEANLRILPSPVVANVGTPAPAVAVPPFGAIAVVAFNPVPAAIDSTRRYTVAGELYPTSRIGVSLAYTDYDDAPLRQERYELGASWFFRPRIAAGFAFSRTKLEPGSFGSYDEDEAGVTISGRF